MKTNPLVSIIIPTYNRAHLIGESLDSVLAQSYANWECIVVDDVSTDSTDIVMAGYCEKDSRFQYYSRPVDRVKGANACRNYGFKKSTGEYLIFLDSDDLLELTCLEYRLDALIKLNNKAQKELCVFNMGLLIKNNKSKRIFNKDFFDSTAYLKEFLKGVVPWTITCVFWERDIFESVGKFDERFERLQDVDLHTRLLLNDVKIHRVHHVDSWYRILDDVKAYVTEDKLPRIINSHIKYLSKYFNYHLDNDWPISSDEIRTCLKENYLNILKKYVFKRSLTCFKQMKELNFENKILKKSQFLYVQLLAFFHLFKLNNIKGIGYFKLRGKVFLEK